MKFYFMKYKFLDDHFVQFIYNLLISSLNGYAILTTYDI